MKKATNTPPDKMAVLLRQKKLDGLREGEIKRTFKLTTEEAAERAQALEGAGEAVILSFDPLFMLSRESLDFLQGKLVKYLEQYHGHHPNELGMDLERLHKRFDLPKKVLTLALRFLVHEGKVQESGGVYSLADFEASLTPAEEGLLAEFEKMSLQGELSASTMKRVERQFHLTPKKAEKLLSVLVERKRVIQSGEGYYVHSGWLDDLVLKIRARPSKELSVADFKELTGLSRKYAIPVLELLDEMGVTRRAGSTREIL
jgi:selenocysteine-specific elongation factor